MMKYGVLFMFFWFAYSLKYPVFRKSNINEDGQKALGVLERYKEQSDCMLEAAKKLGKGCYDISTEEQKWLALDFTLCFLETIGKSVPDCDKKGTIAECLAPLAEVYVTVYNNFFLHIKDLCFYYLALDWQETSGAAIESLFYSLQRVFNETKSVGTAMKENAEKVSSFFNFTLGKIDDVLNQGWWIFFGVSSIQDVLIYLLAIVITTLITSFGTLKAARAYLLTIAFINFFAVEPFIRKIATYSYHKTQCGELCSSRKGYYVILYERVFVLLLACYILIIKKKQRSDSKRTLNLICKRMLRFMRALKAKVRSSSTFKKVRAKTIPNQPGDVQRVFFPANLH